MTAKEERFVEEYCRDCNAAQAAIRAGYSQANAASIAYQLRRKTHIAQAINERLGQLDLSALEATKLVADIARTRLNDFFVVKTKLVTPTVRKGLQQLIDELDRESELEAEYARIAKLANDELKAYLLEQRKRELTGIRYALELERNPRAYRDVPGEARYEEVVEVDMVALARAREVGSVAEVSFNEFGPKIKLYSAAKELTTVLKLHGKLSEKSDPQSNAKTFSDFLMELDSDDQTQ